jgi:hypothetical protein
MHQELEDLRSQSGDATKLQKKINKLTASLEDQAVCMVLS